MSSFDIVYRLRRHLEESGRLSYAMVRREFSLDDETFEAVVEGLVDLQKVARRGTTMLTWAGVGVPASPAATPPVPVRSIAAGHFADVTGSMDLAEQLDHEEWSRIMQRFFTILADGVERFEGFVAESGHSLLDGEYRATGRGLLRAA